MSDSSTTVSFLDPGGSPIALIGPFAVNTASRMRDGSQSARIWPGPPHLSSDRRGRHARTTRPGEPDGQAKRTASRVVGPRPGRTTEHAYPAINGRYRLPET